MVIYAILAAFAIDTSMKSVCAYNENLKSQDLESQQEDINQLGKMTLRFDELLDCRDKDKPFVYEKQVKNILKQTNNLHAPFGKAPAFGAGIRRFESYRRTHFFTLLLT